MDEPLRITIQSRRHEEISRWMHRAARQTDRPLPMLIVSGPIGCGKTAAIHVMAQQAGTTLIEVGASSSDGDVMAIAARSSFNRWLQLVRGRTLEPRVLFIDDADGLLMHTKGGDDGISADLFLQLGMHAIPVVLAVTNWFAGGALLRDLRTKERDVKHVHLVPPPTMAIHRQLAIEFPASDKARGEMLRRIATSCNGDLRRARLEAFLGCMTSRLHDLGRAGVVGGTSSLFDQCKALLGVDGIVPAMPETLQREYRPNAPQLMNMVRTHATCVLPAEATVVDAAIAMTWSIIDAGGHALPPGFDEYLSLVAVPKGIRRQQRRYDKWPSNDDVNFAQPLTGVGQQSMFTTSRRAREVVAAHHFLQWQTLAQTDRLVSCPRGQKKQDQLSMVNESTALRQLWRVRDDIETIHRILGTTPTADMLTLNEMTAALTSVTRSVGARRPWDKVRTIQSDDLTPATKRARTTARDKRASGWRK